MASPPSLASTAQQFSELQSKLTSLLPVCSDTIQNLKSLADGLGKVKDEADEVADSFKDLGKAATTLTAEYEKQGKAMQAMGEAQAKATAHMQALHSQAAPAQGGGGSLISWLKSKFDGFSKKDMPQVGGETHSAAALAAAAGASVEAKPGIVARTKAKLSSAAAALGRGKSALAEADEKGGGDFAEAPMAAFDSLKGLMSAAISEMKEGEVAPPVFVSATASLAKLDETIKAVKASFAEGLAPALEVAATMVAWLVALVQPFTELLIQHTTVVEVLATVFVPLVALLFGVAKVIQFVAWATELWGAAQAVFNLIMAANPIVLFAAAIMAIGLALVYAYKHFERFRAIMDIVVVPVKEFLGYLSRALHLSEMLHTGPDSDEAPTTTKSVAALSGEAGASAPIGLGMSLARNPRSAAGAGGGPVNVIIENLGATTFHVGDLDKKHAVAMRGYVREALLGVLQDVNAPNPALA